jgi:hypothetical protein
MSRTKQIILLVAILAQPLLSYALQEQQPEKAAQDKPAKTARTAPEKQPDRTMLDKGNVENQFEFVFDKSSKYEDYKVIKIGYLNSLRAHILDSIRGIKKKLRETQKVVVAKNSQMDTLKAELQGTNDLLAKITKEKNAISFLGISMAKQYYNSLVWTIIVGLFGLMMVFAFLFRRSNVVTTETKVSLLETKQELEAHRKRALEREEKLSRKYLDELNKYKQQINTV